MLETSMRARIESICRSAGFEPPVILHPARAPTGVDTMLPSEDAIIDELHVIRETISKASNDDIQEIVKAARNRQEQGGRKAVRLPPKRSAPAEKAS
jgi:hypothetical protein